MTKVMLYTGHIAYDTFEESYSYEGDRNPLGAKKAKIFDVSDDTKLKAAFQHVIKDMLEGYDDLDYMFGKNPPAEPSIKLSDLKDNPAKVEKLQKEHERLLAEWKESNIEVERMKAFTAATSFDEYTVEWVESFYQKVANLREDAIGRVYIHTITDPTL